MKEGKQDHHHDSLHHSGHSDQRQNVHHEEHLHKESHTAGKTSYAHPEAGKKHSHSEASVHGHHGGHHEMMIMDFKKRFWISTLISIPILILSPMIQHFFGFRFVLPGNSYILFALSSLVYFWGGWPFLKGFFDEMKAKSPGMMTLIAMAITVAYLYSTATVFGLEGEDFFWELATLIDIMLLGHWLEMRSVMGASKALHLLVTMMPSEAHRMKGDTIEDVKLEELQRDDIVLIKPGEKVAADGIIVGGSSYLNESMLTGESTPVKKQKGDKVIGGSINGNGSLKVSVMHTGKDSYLNKVITLVEEAQKTKSRMQNLSDRAAKWLTYIALGIGFATLATWLLLGYDFVFALERMATVMVIACPHALGLAIPLVVAISTTVSARNGLLIRNRTAFEESRKITSIIFDKTGTLTTGVFGVSRYGSVDHTTTNDEILRLASALEQYSEHPIAAGIINKARELKLSIPKAKEFHAIPGKGVEGIVEGQNIKATSPGYLKEKGIEAPKSVEPRESETVIYVLVNDEPKGFIALSDAIREESKTAIETFKKNRIKTYMATGDNEKVAKAVARELGLDGYFAEVLPHEKAEIVKQFQEKNEFVAMTGDGVNDAPALAQANVGIAVGSGTDIAAETADIVLVNSNPHDIANLILFGKASYQKMVQNIAWAVGYNVVAIPLAAGILYSSGFVLSPAVGAVLMSLSTIIVAINAQLLRKKIGKIQNAS